MLETAVSNGSVYNRVSSVGVVTRPLGLDIGHQTRVNVIDYNLQVFW